MKKPLSDTLVLLKSQDTSPEHSFENDTQRLSDRNVTNVSSNTKSMLASTLPMDDKWKYIEIKAFFKALSIVFLSDMENEGQERWELASFICDNVVCRAKQDEVITITFS